MSVYIKGMEMPTSCDDCPMMAEADDYCVCFVNDKFIPWRWASESGEEQVHDKPEWCPLVPVPPHGRLGDLDAAVEKLKRLREYHLDDSHSGGFIALGISQCIDVLSGREAPTIIPASTADKEVEG